jgi:uncharacterized protein YxeA
MKGQKGKNVFTYEEIERKECCLHMKGQKGKNVFTYKEIERKECFYISLT